MIKMEELILREETYAREREQVVKPYLEERMTEKKLFREPGRRIHTVSYRTDAPKAVVVISHGFTESVKKYEEPVYYFLKQGFDVVIPEHCGHGCSYRLVKDLSLVHVDRFERYVQDLLYVIRYARKDHPDLPLILFGHSMGGGIAAETASRIPELVDILVLSSPMIRPLTGNIPWQAAYVMSNAACLMGKSKNYVMGQKPFADDERFETSSSLSRGRFAYYYDNVKRKDPRYQTSAASYGWLKEALGLSRMLLGHSWKTLTMPVLLTQAGKDAFVSSEAQSKLIRKLIQNGNQRAKLLYFQEAKHECYNGYDKLVENYWNQVFAFLASELNRLSE